MLCANPPATGSSGVIVTIGMVRVALYTANTPEVAPVKMTSGLRATSSRASDGMRSATPSPWRNASVILRPSTYPRSRNADRNAATLRLAATAESGDNNPISGRTGDGCARAVSGQATAVPSTPRNSRRFMSVPSPLDKTLYRLKRVF